MAATTQPPKVQKVQKAQKVVQQKTAPKSGAVKKGKKSLRFIIDCTQPAEDGIMDPSSFEKFLQTKIKVNGKAGALGDSVTITRDKTKLTIVADSAFSKKYLKYLSKKYLKKQQLRDWLRVVATTKQGYELRYYGIHDDEEEAEQ